MGTPRTTASVKFGNLTTIQIFLTGANQFSDAQALDDVVGGGAGPFLVMERGIFKYPQQAAGGRIVIPVDTGRPVRLVHLTANLGASAGLTLHIAGIDGTGARPDNVSEVPYDSGDAALYREGDIIVDTFAATQYISKSYDLRSVDPGVLLHPGQHLYFISTAAAGGAILRATFALGWDWS
jgi:hypothetical protein